MNDLRPGTKIYNPRYTVMKALSGIKEISKVTRNKRMSNARIQQIVTLLYAHNEIVTSDGVHYKAKYLVKELEDRMLKNIKYYENNDLITANFKFLKIVIDNWYKTK